MERVRKHIYRREGVLWYMRRVPKDVRDLPESTLKAVGLPKHQYWRSLHTGDAREIDRRIGRVHSEFDQKVRRARNYSFGDATPASDQKAFAYEPDTPDLERLVRDWLSAYEDRQIEAVRSPEAIGELEETVASLSAALSSLVIPMNTQWIAATIIEEHALDIPAEGRLFHRFCRLILRGQLERYRRAIEEAQGQFGQVHDTLFEASHYAQDRAEGPQNFATVAKLKDDWLNQVGTSTDEKTRGLKAYRSGVIVEALGPTRKVRSITREECEAVLRDVIRKYPRRVPQRLKDAPLTEVLEDAEKSDAQLLSPTTQKLYLQNMRSMFSYAVKTGLRSDDPTALLEVRVPFRKTREPFSMSELQTLFDARVFTGIGDDETDEQAPDPTRRDRFWVPLIALHSGLRVDEICQFGKDDLVEKNGVHCFDVWADDREGRHTKNASSIRTIPIHPTLVDIGLLEYAKDQQDGRGGLFPNLTGHPKGSGSDGFSKWFGRLCDSRGLTKSTLTFHSFRHNFRDALRETEAPEAVQKYLGGWSAKDVHEKYGHGPSTGQKSRWIAKVDYPDLDLSRLDPLL